MITSNMSRPRAERQSNERVSFAGAVMGAGRGEGSASDEPQSNERVSAGAGAVMGAGRGEGSASDEPQSNERVSSERDN
jgi:hypothetical protein